MHVPMLRTVREQKFLTRQELAERAGVSYHNIVRLELGGTARITTVRKLAQALGVEPAELVGQEQGSQGMVAAA